MTIAVKDEDYGQNTEQEQRLDEGLTLEMEPLASTSTEHMETQACVEDCRTGPSADLASADVLPSAKDLQKEELQPEQPLTFHLPDDSSALAVSKRGPVVPALYFVKSEEDCANTETLPITIIPAEHTETNIVVNDFGTPEASCKENISTEQLKKNRDCLVMEEPEPPNIEHEFLFRPEEGLAVMNSQYRETETVVACTSTHQMRTFCDAEHFGTRQSTSHNQLLSSSCSESDTEDSDEWEENNQYRSDLNSLNSHPAENIGASSLSKKQRQGMKSSKQMCHTEKRGFDCKDCGKTFILKWNLEQHMQTPFGCMEKKVFPCKHGGKTFNLKWNLKQHMLTHTEKKPSMCGICGKGFSQISNLKTHMRTHTGERPFSCTVCGKAYSHRVTLKYHMSTHTGEYPFTCPVCGKGFGHSWDMKRHLGTHTRERSFTCTVCDRAFSQMHNLKTHMRTHTVEKPIKSSLRNSPRK